MCDERCRVMFNFITTEVSGKFMEPSNLYSTSNVHLEVNGFSSGLRESIVVSPGRLSSSTSYRQSDSRVL